MNRFQHILVVLPTGAPDSSVLDWAHQIAGVAGTRRLDFLLLDPEPADWVPEYAGAREPGEDRLAKARREISHRFADLAADLETRSGVGAPLPTILNELADGSADLVVLGVADEVGRRLAEKVARKCPASVLCVPADSPARCRTLLTPVDFSESSALSLDLAGAFARSLGVERITCLHSFQISNRGIPAGLTPEQLREDYLRVTSPGLDDFVKSSPAASLETRNIVREVALPSTAVLDELSSNPCDLVVMGTRGRSSLARALLGSNTAEVIRRSPVPVLAARAKGEGLSLLRTILAEARQSASTPAPAT